MTSVTPRETHLKTAYISHRECHQHDTGEGHPENARRISAIEDRFVATGLFDVLRYYDAPLATDEQLLRVHSPAHLEAMIATIPDKGFTRLDPDTVISPGSLTAARRAAGARAVRRFESATPTFRAISPSRSCVASSGASSRD